MKLKRKYPKVSRVPFPEEQLVLVTGMAEFYCYVPASSLKGGLTAAFSKKNARNWRRTMNDPLRDIKVEVVTDAETLERWKRNHPSKNKKKV